MKRAFYLMFLSFLILSLTQISTAEEERFFVDRVIAVVNKEVITWSELYKYMEFNLKEEVKNLNPDEKYNFLKKREEEFLEKIIDTKLQIEEAEKYGIFVTDDEINTAIEDIKKKYNLTNEQFEESLKKEGLTLTDYKKLMKEQITIGRALNSLIRSKIIVTDEEIKNFISSHPEISCEEEGYYVSQIFVKHRDNENEIKNRVQEILMKLVQGESFSKVASLYSEDLTGKNGGSLGLLKKKEISPELNELFSKMEINQISEPMITSNGIYIFKLDGICFKKDSEALKNYARKTLEDAKFNREYKLWVRGLRQRAYIEIMD